MHVPHKQNHNHYNNNCHNANQNPQNQNPQNQNLQKPEPAKPEPAKSEPAKPEPAKPVSQQLTQSQPQQKQARVQHNDKPQKDTPQPEPTEKPKPMTISKPKQAPPKDEKPADDPSSSKSLELTRSEALSRISLHPKPREADLTDAEVLNMYVRMRDDQDPLTWMILGYDNSISQDKLFVTASGMGDFQEFAENIIEGKPIYMYLNYKFGDTGRSRFIVMSYVPEALNGLQKARVVGHRGAVESFIKYYQISWHCLSIEEITEPDLSKKLRTAGGADYSVQEENKGNFSNYKTQTKEFYSETDKNTKLKSLVYGQGPLVTTPCDISGRAMVAPTSEVKKKYFGVFQGK